MDPERTDPSVRCGAGGNAVLHTVQRDKPIHLRRVVPLDVRAREKTAWRRARLMHLLMGKNFLVIRRLGHQKSVSSCPDSTEARVRTRRRSSEDQDVIRRDYGWAHEMVLGMQYGHNVICADSRRSVRLKDGARIPPSAGPADGKRSFARVANKTGDLQRQQILQIDIPAKRDFSHTRYLFGWRYPLIAYSMQPTIITRCLPLEFRDILATQKHTIFPKCGTHFIFSYDQSCSCTPPQVYNPANHKKTASCP